VEILSKSPCPASTTVPLTLYSQNFSLTKFVICSVFTLGEGLAKGWSKQVCIDLKQTFY